MNLKLQTDFSEEEMTEETNYFSLQFPSRNWFPPRPPALPPPAPAALGDILQTNIFDTQRSSLTHVEASRKRFGSQCLNYNHEHNILRRFDSLANFLFTTSENEA